MKDKTIYLIGFYASGKRRQGKKLAKHLNKTYVNLKSYIEEKERMTIEQIIEFRGENFLRKLETSILESNIFKNCVVALGVNTPVYNMELIKKNGISIYFRLHLFVIRSRVLKKSPSGKIRYPIFEELNASARALKLTKLFEKIEPFYKQSDISINMNQYYEGIMKKIDYRLNELLTK